MRPSRDLPRRDGDEVHADSRTAWLRESATRLIVSAFAAITATALASGGVLAHSGHGHAETGGTGTVLPAALILGSALVVGAGAYVDRTDRLDGRLARAGILLGVVGLFVGTLLTLF